MKKEGKRKERKEEIQKGKRKEKRGIRKEQVGTTVVVAEEKEEE